MFGDDLVWRSDIQHTLAPGVVGLVEPAQELFEGAMRVDVDIEHLAGDASIEPFDDAVIRQAVFDAHNVRPFAAERG